MRYVNMFGFLLLFLSTSLTVFILFVCFYVVMCGDFNFVPSYSMVETGYNMVFGVGGLYVYIYIQKMQIVVLQNIYKF
jgi:hypothetical protein